MWKNVKELIYLRFSTSEMPLFEPSNHNGANKILFGTHLISSATLGEHRRILSCDWQAVRRGKVIIFCFSEIRSVLWHRRILHDVIFTQYYEISVHYHASFDVKWMQVSFVIVTHWQFYNKRYSADLCEYIHMTCSSSVLTSSVVIHRVMIS